MPSQWYRTGVGDVGSAVEPTNLKARSAHTSSWCRLRGEAALIRRLSPPILPGVPPVFTSVSTWLQLISPAWTTTLLSNSVTPVIQKPHRPLRRSVSWSTRRWPIRDSCERRPEVAGDHGGGDSTCAGDADRNSVASAGINGPVHAELSDPAVQWMQGAVRERTGWAIRRSTSANNSRPVLSGVKVLGGLGLPKDDDDEVTGEARGCLIAGCGTDVRAVRRRSTLSRHNAE